MTEFERTLLKRLESLESEVAILRAQARTKKAANKSDRVTVAEIAEKFNVCAETVRRMQGEFAGLYKTVKKTESGRFYWHRADYEQFCKLMSLSPADRLRQIEQSKKPRRKTYFGTSKRQETNL